MYNTVKRIITLFIFTASLSFGLNAQTPLTNYESASKYFDELFGSESHMDKTGNVLINMGSASAGRHQFDISDVNILMEKREEEPGCADVCPPRILIHFECKNSACMSDPTLDSYFYRSGVIEFYDLRKGKEAYEYLLGLREFVKKD